MIEGLGFKTKKLGGVEGDAILMIALCSDRGKMEVMVVDTIHLLKLEEKIFYISVEMLPFELDKKLSMARRLVRDKMTLLFCFPFGQ